MRAPTAPAFAGAAGYVASWRRAIGGSGAFKIGGSPIKMLVEAEQACNAILKHLTNEAASEARYALPPTIIS
jgi:hypothetical protein